MTGLSLVVAIRDAPAALQATLPAWEAADEVAEIVVVDVASAIPLARLGLLERPKIVLVEAGRDAQGAAEPWARGLALNLGVAAASGDAVLVVEPGQALASPFAVPGDVAGIVSGIAGAGPASASGAAPALFRRESFLALGGFHEYLLGSGFEDQDLFNRFENAGERRRFFRDGALVAVPTAGAEAGPGLGGTRARADDGGLRVELPEELRASPFFQGERNKLLAGMVPWSASLAAMRPRRTGRRGARHFSTLLAPRTPLELRTQDVASYLAARILFHIPEETVIPMLAGMIDDRSQADAGRATRQFQIELASALARGGSAP